MPEQKEFWAEDSKQAEVSRLLDRVIDRINRLDLSALKQETGNDSFSRRGD